MARWIIEIAVDADTNRDVRVFGRSGDDHFLCTSVDVLLSTRAIDEETGRFQNNINTLVAPAEVRRVTLCGNEDFMTANDQVVSFS